MTDLPAVLELPPALVVLPGAKSATADAAGARELRPPYAREMIEEAPVLLAHAAIYPNESTRASRLARAYAESDQVLHFETMFRRRD
ncbi:MAG TPA: hypothetical protein PLF78_08375, partial [Caulobacter sp.]|nr:hypothetical protein [Caulobacter sp.]